MAIDRRRLARDAKAAEKARPVRSVGQPSTGALAAVEANLDMIRALRADGVRWAAIADALSGQGVHQIVDGERRPLSATRLTGFVRVIEKRAERTAAKRTERAARPGLARPPSDGRKVAGSSPRSLALSPELQPDPNDPRDTDAPSHETEEGLRRSRLDAVRRLTKE